MAGHPGSAQGTRSFVAIIAPRLVRGLAIQAHRPAVECKPSFSAESCHHSILGSRLW